MVNAVDFLEHLKSICTYYGNCWECPLNVSSRPLSEQKCPRIKSQPCWWVYEDILTMVNTTENEYAKISNGSEGSERK